MAKFYFSSTKQKILLLLLAGTVLALNRSSKVHWRIIKGIPKAWKSINRRTLYRVMHEFYRDRLVDFRDEKDGSTVVVLSEKGMKRALRYKIDELTISKPARWDSKWRIVIFDIPEKKKKAREALRTKLQELGFVQLQKSVWIHPYPCKDIIDFIIEVFEIRSYVVYIETSYIAHDAKLKLHFKLY